MRLGKFKLVAGLLAFALVAGACGDDDDTATTVATTPTTAAIPPTTAPPTTTAVPPTTEPTPVAFDANGDGQVVIGIAAAGPRDDGAYYQAVVDGAQTFAAEQGWAEPIVVDNISAEDAATDIENLAQQVDIMIIGAGEIAAPMADLAEQYSDVFWYCNCGAGWPQSEFYTQSQDDGSELNYTAGVAVGLLLQESGGDSVFMLGCCDLGFEKESFLALELGLKAVDDTFTATYVGTGAFPFDFDNTAGATEAFNNAVAAGADAVYAFLGGAMNPVGQLANDAGVFSIAAGISDACSRTDVAWDMTVRFDGGDYVLAIFPGILDGSVVEGSIKQFRVGVDPEGGAEICNPSAEAQAALDEAYDLVGSGALDDEFGAIKGVAYAG